MHRGKTKVFRTDLEHGQLLKPPAARIVALPAPMCCQRLVAWFGLHRVLFSLVIFIQIRLLGSVVATM